MPVRCHKATYGIDAPYLLPLPLLAVAGNCVQGFVSGRKTPFVAAAAIAGCMALGMHASLRGKFRVWSELLDGLRLRGDERVLDLGCGRGAVLLAVARRLTTGRAVGVDLWKAADQSGNRADATLRNAVAEGVDDRVELVTADMTALPFEDNRFDLVVSNIAVHNVKGGDRRNRAIDEAVRVLRPGGRLMVADLRGTRGYRDRLAAHGMTDVACRGLGWRMWWSGPWCATRLVSATKPIPAVPRREAMPGGRAIPVPAAPQGAAAP
jgi:SAM-dependent methyltransferase